MTEPRARLLELLSAPAEQGAREASHAFDALDLPGGRAVVVFGAGELGRRVVACLRAAGRPPTAFADNRFHAVQQDAVVDGTPAMSPAAAVARFGAEAVYVLGVYTPRAAAAQLRELGVTRVAHYAQAFARFGGLPFMCLGEPDRIAAEAADVLRAFDLLTDAPSRAEFVRQIERRLLLGFTETSDVPDATSRRYEYFDPSIYRRRADEVFVDCGAYDGDTIRRFLEEWGGEFERIVALEPDPASRGRLEAFRASLASGQAERVRIEPYALASAPGELRFDAGGVVSSAARADGPQAVRAERLDTILRDERPTLIKMDLEGSELDALAGATGVIGTAAPVMAVTVYHRCDHLWRVPLALAALRGDYRFALRAHAADCWDASAYAVPPSR